MRADIIESLKAHSNISKAKLSNLMNLPIEMYAQGAEIIDEKGDTYLDCGGFGVFILGHRHPEIVESVIAQINRMPMSSRSLVNSTLAEASKKLAQFCPAALEYTFFTNSGAESTELALKLARANDCQHIVAITGSYHGKTLGALSVTHRAEFRAPFAPLFAHVSFIERNNLVDLHRVFNSIDAKCAVILEPTQGEGGVYPLDTDFVNQAFALCKAKNGLFIADEIQTGLCRTGRNWAIEAYDVKPDILLVGKGLSGGIIPCAAVVATAAAFEPLNRDFMLHSSTFGGSPVALAAAIKTLDILERDNVSKQAYTLGHEIMTRLQHKAAEVGIIIRGQGLLIGLDTQCSAKAGLLTLSLLKQKIITSHSLSHATTVRLTPSICLTRNHIDTLVAACITAFEELKTKEIFS